MLKQAFILLIAFSLAFPVTGAECPASNEKCLQQACLNSGGDFNEKSYCVKGAKFDEPKYSQNLGVCAQMDEFCVENDGLVRNMSCFGPVFILLAALLFSCADGTP